MEFQLLLVHLNPTSLLPAFLPWCWRLALLFAALASPRLQPRVAAGVCTLCPASLLFSRTPQFPSLQNMVWFNSVTNRSLDYPVLQHWIKMPTQCKFRLSNNLLFQFVLVPILLLDSLSILKFCVESCHLSIPFLVQNGLSSCLNLHT